MKYTEEVDIENLIRLLYSGTLTQYGKRKLIDYLRKLEEQVEYDKTHIITPQTIELNYIPKKTIREKIKELKDNRSYLSKFDDWKEKEYTNEDNNNMCVEVLEDLLGE